MDLTTLLAELKANPDLDKLADWMQATAASPAQAAVAADIFGADTATEEG